MRTIHFYLSTIIIPTFLGMTYVQNSYGQGTGNHVTMDLENFTQPTTKTIKFDMYIVSDGASTSDLRANSVIYGINYSSTILQSGATLTASVAIASVDGIFPNRPYSSSFPSGPTGGYFKLTQSPCSGCDYGATGTVNV